MALPSLASRRRAGAHGIEVRDILGLADVGPHPLAPHAVVDGTRVVYLTSRQLELGG